MASADDSLSEHVVSQVNTAIAVLIVLLTAGATTDAWAVTATDALLERLEPNGFVNDFAQVLTAPQRDSLERRVRDLQQKTGAELSVVTVKSLEGGQIDDFTNKLFQRWGVGQKGKNNGIMLLVAMQDHKMRIEVGYGLEPVLPDVLAGRIIDEELRPQFRQSRYAEGLSRAVEQIATIVERGEPASRIALGLSHVFRPSTEPLADQVLLTVALSLFVVIGSYQVGVGTVARRVVMVVWGLFFGGAPLIVAFMFGGFAPIVLLPLWMLVFALACVYGRRHPAKFRAGRGRYRSGSSWAWDATSGGSSDWSSGGFSSSDSGGFGGGSSGGGGASGGW
jgi:uncharacterized protein